MVRKFISADPLISDPTNGQGYNRYAYVLNNPTNLVDPTGFRTEEPILGAGQWETVYKAAREPIPGSEPIAAEGESDQPAGAAASRGDPSSKGGQASASRTNGSSINSDPIRGSVQTSHIYGPNIAGTHVRRIKSPDYASAEVGTMFRIAGFGATAAFGGSAASAYRTYQAAKRIESLSKTPETPLPALLKRYLEGKGGRWGGTATRRQNHEIASELESQGYTITGGAGRAPEEWIPGPNGGTLGGTFVDITAVNGSSVTRVQTVTTTADGVTPTMAEAEAAGRIRAAFPDDLLQLIPKK